MKIELPGIKDQLKVIFEESTKEAIATLKRNLNAQAFKGPDIDESPYPNTHLLRKSEGWEPPHKDVAAAYFDNFKEHFVEYNSDNKIAALLGLSSGRRIREFKQGKYTVPYGVWREFLVITGRAPQDVLEVKGFFK
ncbi:MAG: hypothetical protein COC04_00885 [Gammaproteobacteria bacterium]|nr:MAG: hypothetical protein COC04_00885 [Gammaproteobacteria bacterium]